MSFSQINYTFREHRLCGYHVTYIICHGHVESSNNKKTLTLICHKMCYFNRRSLKLVYVMLEGVLWLSLTLEFPMTHKI